MNIINVITTLQTITSLETVMYGGDVASDKPLNEKVPAVYVTSAGERAASSYVSSQHVQTLNHAVQVMLVCSHADFPSVRDEILNKLAGLPLGSFNMEFSEGKMIDATTNLIYWKDVFTIQRQIRRA